MWFELADLFRRQPAQPSKAIGQASAMKFLEPGDLRLGGGDDNLSATLVGDAVILAKPIHGVAAFGAKSGFEGARFVIQAGMNDAAVMARLVCADAVFGFQHDQTG